MRRRRGGAQVFRITGARTGLSEDVRGRQRRYVLSMGVRTLCFLTAVTLWNVERPLAWLALVAGTVLPYIAVVIANAGRENAPGVPESVIHTQGPPRLEARSGGNPPPGPPSSGPGPSSRPSEGSRGLPPQDNHH